VIVVHSLVRIDRVRIVMVRVAPVMVLARDSGRVEGVVGRWTVARPAQESGVARAERDRQATVSLAGVRPVNLPDGPEVRAPGPHEWLVLGALVPGLLTRVTTVIVVARVLAEGPAEVPVSGLGARRRSARWAAPTVVLPAQAAHAWAVRVQGQVVLGLVLVPRALAPVAGATVHRPTRVVRVVTIGGVIAILHLGGRRQRRNVEQLRCAQPVVNARSPIARRHRSPHRGSVSSGSMMVLFVAPPSRLLSVP